MEIELLGYFAVMLVGFCVAWLHAKIRDGLPLSSKLHWTSLGIMLVINIVGLGILKYLMPEYGFVLSLLFLIVSYVVSAVLLRPQLT
jgi:hypothetical protein